jgi:hypothetical protein
MLCSWLGRRAFAHPSSELIFRGRTLLENLALGLANRRAVAQLYFEYDRRVLERIRRSLVGADHTTQGSEVATYVVARHQWGQHEERRQLHAREGVFAQRIVPP